MSDVYDKEFKDFTNEPLVLYLDLEENSFIELETSYKIEKAFEAALKELLFIIDPSAELKICLVSVTEGSISFNTLLRIINQKNKDVNLDLKSIVYACMVWFALQTAAHTYDKILDYITSSPAHIELTKEQKNYIANRVACIIEKRIAHQQVQLIYRAAHADKAIKAIGSTRTFGSRPNELVPRSEFPFRAGMTDEVVHGASRTRHTEEIATLVSPVLLHDTNRKWRFRGEHGEYGASIKDEDFLNKAVNGALGMHMVEGIQFFVQMEIKEEFKDDVWQIKDRFIKKIMQYKFPRNYDFFK